MQQVEINWTHKYLLQSWCLPPAWTSRLALNAMSRETTWQSETFLRSSEHKSSEVQLSFHDIAMVGATHLHGCGFQPPIWWLRCLGHPSMRSHTCGLDGSCRQLVNWSWAAMVREEGPRSKHGLSGVRHGRFGERRRQWLLRCLCGYRLLRLELNWAAVSHDLSYLKPECLRANASG